MKIILFNKPYGVLSQFTGATKIETLSAYIDVLDFYAAGRLDKDSEGLLLLTNNGKLQQKLSDPNFKCEKIYWAQVENVPTLDTLKKLCEGVMLKDGLTRPAKVKIIPPPEIWLREPPIRYRRNISTCWLEIILTEGRNRQVRRMTAAVGHPTLRLIRIAIGSWRLEDLQPGEWRFAEH